MFLLTFLIAFFHPGLEYRIPSAREIRTVRVRLHGCPDRNSNRTRAPAWSAYQRRLFLRSGVEAIRGAAPHLPEATSSRRAG